MHTTRYKITIIRDTKPHTPSLNQDLQWFGQALGLFSLRDKDKSCFRLFIELLKAAKLQRPLSSDELAHRLHITRGTVVHHLNKMMESGIVTPTRKHYMLRDDKLAELINHIKKDMNDTLQELEKVSEELDEMMGL